MNNISYPQDWGKPSRKFEEIHWRASVNGDPKIKDVYIVTMRVDGIEDFTTSADWDGEKWNNELIGEVIAYAKFPLGYIK